MTNEEAFQSILSSDDLDDLIWAAENITLDPPQILELQNKIERLENEQYTKQDIINNKKLYKKLRKDSGVDGPQYLGDGVSLGADGKFIHEK